eukprot:CAMPEP_0170211322 /NCGR_PEP_ID=MMETSP0116_2-20130129/5277_1 /TAXON_ID=400756 /ORGANISM="Durinskia baltica, Strain CSIRO CS-38" /LENGTH=397 /DNA_ID=CAMNT_0010461857 /DNA_START=116 /DNA_END=1306 /DNA_ORIENTATION=+
MAARVAANTPSSGVQLHPSLSDFASFLIEPSSPELVFASDCTMTRCLDWGPESDGDWCCDQRGACGTLAQRSTLQASQLFCAQRRLDGVAELLRKMLVGPNADSVIAAAAAASDLGPHMLAAVHRRAEAAARQRDEFARDGFVALRGALSSKQIDDIYQSLRDVIWAEDPALRPFGTLDLTEAGEFTINKSMSMRDATLDLRQMPHRIAGLDQGPEQVQAGVWNRMFYNSHILEIVQRLLDGPVRLVQSLFFERGSEQEIHDDTWYLPGSDRASSLIAVWIALDDVDEHNGPIRYIPGSHSRPLDILNPEGKSRRWKLRLSEAPGSARSNGDGRETSAAAAQRRALAEVQRMGLREVEFLAKAGDVGIGMSDYCMQERRSETIRAHGAASCFITKGG